MLCFFVLLSDGVAIAVVCCLVVVAFGVATIGHFMQLFFQ